MYSGGTVASYGYRGQVGEIVAYNRFLSTTETTEVEGYLACKWGLQSRLAAGHPYRTACPGSSTPTPAPSPTATALPEPVQLISKNGQLTVNVTAVQDATTHNPALTYKRRGNPADPTPAARRHADREPQEHDARAARGLDLR